MKKIIAVLFSILFLCIAVCGCGEIRTGDLSFKPYDELVVFTPDSIPEEAAELFSMEKSKLKENMESSGILLSGARKDRRLSFTVISETTEFSKRVGDFSVYTQLELNEIAKTLVPDYLSCFKTDDATYIFSDGNVMGPSRPFCTRQYVTVKNGKLYVVSFTTDDEMFELVDENNIIQVMNSLSIKKDLSSDMLSIIIVSVSLLAVAALVVFIVISLVKDIKNRNKKA